MTKLTEVARTPAEIREFLDSGRSRNIFRRTDLSSQCVGSELKCWGLPLDPNAISMRFRLPLVGRPPRGRTFRKFLAHLVRGRQPSGCDATTWYSDRVKAAAKGCSKSKDCPLAARHAVPSAQLCLLSGVRLLT